MRRPTSAMPAPEKKGDKEGEESSVSRDSSYEEVEEEVVPKGLKRVLPAKAKGVAKKSAARPPPEVGISSSDSVSPAPTRPPRGAGGHIRPKSPPDPPKSRGKERERPRGRSVAPAASAAKNPSSSDSEPGEGIHKSGKGSKKGSQKGKKGRQRCGICWSKVSSGEACPKQHQRWNTTCIAWGYHNQGMPWDQAQEKAQRKKERREQKAWEGVPEESAPSRPKAPETKEKRKDKGKRRASPSPEARAPDRKRYKKDPDNSSDDERLPKVRSKGKEIIIRLPRAR